MTHKKDWQPRPADIPQQPGVYRFLGPEGSVLYVGKAKSLRARLSSYFGAPEGMHERTRTMVSQAISVDWTVVPTERQALQLEYLWIKEFQPPFNVRFRDDKSYPYLVVTLAEAIPRVFLARKKNISGAKYFGPFPTAWALRETLSTLLKAFPVRSCSASVYETAQRAKRPCLLGDIGKCAAPCVGRISPESHKALALSFSQFMAGNDTTVLSSLNHDMARAAENLDFERAARLRDRIEAINTILTKNTMVLADTVDADVFGMASDSLVTAAHVFRVRGGRIRSAKGFVVDTPSSATPSELVEWMLRDAFDDYPPATTVVVPQLPAQQQAWQQELTARRAASGEKGSVSLKVPQRGELAELLRTVTLNAQHTLTGYLASRTTDPSSRSRGLAEIAEALHLAEAPLRIECFDVSHLGGENPVASMVVFEDGLAKRTHYRKFALQAPRDDTEALAQVLARRIARLTDSSGTTSSGFSYPPGLIVVDGGLPQVRAAAAQLASQGVSIPVCGLAKKLEEVWLPDSDFPVILPRNSEGLFLLQRIRDEAHRVAITYQRQTRKRALSTELTDIPGVGPKLAHSLLTAFGSLARIRQASLEHLAAVPGVGRERAETIFTYLNHASRRGSTMGESATQ